AVLRAEADGLAQAQWTAPDELRVGHLALALARPGETVRAALGIVSALGGEWVTGVGGRVDRYLQADITMYPGFSGGPLVDSSGRVMGVNTSGLRRRADVTVPFPTVKRVVNALLEHGEVRRGFLGVSTQPVRLPTAVAERAGQETGLLVTGVSEGAPAEQAGISLGDVIVSLRDRKIRAVDDLLTALGESETGVGVAVRIVRANETKDLEVTIGERPRGG
ncbi:MAG: S1C family serine protease, partial [Chloroflexota bacterium]